MKKRNICLILSLILTICITTSCGVTPNYNSNDNVPSVESNISIENNNTAGDYDEEENIYDSEVMPTIESQLHIEECVNEQISYYDEKFSEGLCPFEDTSSGLYGYINKNMDIVVQPQFFDALPFHEGLAGVFDGYNWGFIDSTGNYVFSPQYHDILCIDSATANIDYKGFNTGMALVEDAGNASIPSWNSEKKIYYLLNSDGSSKKLTEREYLNTYFNNLIVCNDVLYLNHFGSDITILNNDGTVNYQLSSAFQTFAQRDGYSKYSISMQSISEDSSAQNYSNCMIVFCDTQRNNLISDNKGNLKFDLRALQEYYQIEQIKVYNNVVVIKRKINGIEQSAVYDYNYNVLLNYQYMDIKPVCINGEAKYFVCFDHNYDSIVLNENCQSIPELDKYCYADNMDSYDGKTYLLAVHKDDASSADIIECPNHNIVTTIKLDINLIAKNGVKFNYAGICNGVVLIACDDTYVYDYVYDNMQVINSTLSDLAPVFLDTGICFEQYSQNYYKITGFPLNTAKADHITIKGTQYSTDLTELDLSNLELTDDDVKDIDKMTNLTILNLGGNKISNIEPLKNLTNLTELDLWYNQISDVKPLENLKKLENLSLYNNKINDVKPLWNLTNLTRLDLSCNEIKDISFLENLTNLTTLDLVDNQISDITPLKNLTNLTWLSIGSNQINDLSPLENLTNLTTLNLGSNQISDISSLNNLNTNLTYLNLRDNQISDISPLNNMTKSSLTDLTLSYNQISDITSLKNLTNLTRLSIGSNQISDLSPLENLTNLTTIYLQSNKISNIYPLKNLNNLTQIYLYENQISSEDVKDLERSLTDCDIYSEKPTSSRGIIFIESQ